jgi:hypothetical protein
MSQHKNAQHKNAQHNDTQHNKILLMILNTASFCTLLNIIVVLRVTIQYYDKCHHAECCQNQCRDAECSGANLTATIFKPFTIEQFYKSRNQGSLANGKGSVPLTSLYYLVYI